MKKSLSSLFVLCLLLAASFLLSSCYFANLKMNEDDLKAVLRPHENDIGQSTQMILVRERGFLFSSVYFVYAMEKADGHWKCVSDPIPAKVGRNGFALSGEKREGDGKTPSGIFSLKRTFALPGRSTSSCIACFSITAWTPC